MSGHLPPCVWAPVAQAARIFGAKTATFVGYRGRRQISPPPVRFYVYGAVIPAQGIERRLIGPLALGEYHRPFLGLKWAYQSTCGKWRFLGLKWTYHENR